MEDPVNDLKALVTEGVVEDIRQIEETIGLYQEITSRAGAINESGLGPLFSRLQLISSRHAIFVTIRLFEPPDNRYPSRSIPTVLNHMRYTADYLQVKNSETIVNRLAEFGHDTTQFEGIPDPWITQLIRKEFADRLPDITQPDSNATSSALDSLYIRRDKYVAHSEEVQSLKEWQAMESDIGTLLEYARDFAATIGKGYLGIDYQLGEGDSVFRLDRERTVIMLRRLLELAGIGN